MQGLTETAANAGTTVQSSPEQQLRSLFYRNEIALFMRDGEGLLQASKNSLEGRAWYLAQAPFLEGEAYLAVLPLLNVMEQEAPQDPWTLAARTIFEADFELSIWLAEKAIANDSREDILLLCTKGMLGRPDGDDHANLLAAFLERHRTRFEASADALAVLADGVRNARPAAERKLPSEEAAALYDRALKMDPANVFALAAKCRILTFRNQFKEAAALLEQSEAVLDCESLHFIYFYVVLPNLPDLSEEEKAVVAERIGRKLIARQEPSRDYLDTLLHTIGEFKPRADAILDLVFELYPGSNAAAFAILTRSLGTYNPREATSEQKKEAAVKLIEFLKPRVPCTSEVDNYAIGLLSQIASASELSTEQLIEAVNTIPPEHSLEVVQDLANRKTNLPELERIACRQVERLVCKANRHSLAWRQGLPMALVFFFKKFWLGVAAWEEVLGLIYLHQGRLDDAEVKFTTSMKLQEMDRAPAGEGTFADDALMTTVHLAQLAVAKGDYEQAEQRLERAMAIEAPGEHPAIQIYRDLYLRKHGNSVGLDEYMATMSDGERGRRKKAILNGRIAEAQPVPPFQLTTLDGKTVSSQELKGKIAVIKFWGVWCRYCVKELPEFQQFYEKYKDDPRVAMLTINAKDTVEKVKAFVAKRNYTFPVLLEGEYVSQVKIKGFPTAWFLDGDGKKIFEKLGDSKELIEEFTWRVEELLADAATI